MMLSTYKISRVFTDRNTEVKWVKIPPPPANPSSFRDNPSLKMRWIFSKAGGWSISRFLKKWDGGVQLGRQDLQKKMCELNCLLIILDHFDMMYD